MAFPPCPWDVLEGRREKKEAPILAFFLRSTRLHEIQVEEIENPRFVLASYEDVLRIQEGSLILPWHLAFCLFAAAVQILEFGEVVGDHCEVVGDHSTGHMDMVAEEDRLAVEAHLPYENT